MSENQTLLVKKNYFPLRIADARVLESIYMPFLKNGGLFVPVSTDVALGDEVFLLISLFDKPTSIALCATVIWITPDHSAEKKSAGFGVCFKQHDKKIKTILEGAMPDEKNTQLQSYTM